MTATNRGSGGAGYWMGRVPPSDWVTLAILAVVVTALGVRLQTQAGLAMPLLLHVLMLIGYVGIMCALVGFEDSGWVPVGRAVAVVAVMFTLYSTLGHMVFVAIPWEGDSWLAAADRLLFAGTAPTLWVEPFVTPPRLEFMSFVYAFFIPYLYMSIFLGCVARPDAERDEFVTGFAILYAVSFVGYMLLPARGPIVHQAGEYPAALSGGLFHQLVVGSIDRMGGPHGAFPSLHVGASVYACFFDMRYNRLRFMTYLPIVVLIAAATVLLRYHYVVDLVAGAVFAIIAAKLAPVWLRSYERRSSPSSVAELRP